MARQESWEFRELQELKEPLDLPEFKDNKEHKGLWEIPVCLEILALLGRQVLQVTQESLVLRVSLELLDYKDLPVRLV